MLIWSCLSTSEAELEQKYNPSWVRGLNLSLAVFMASCKFGAINECFLVEVEASSSKPFWIVSDLWILEHILHLICIGLGMQTFSPIGGNEASVSRQM